MRLKTHNKAFKSDSQRLAFSLRSSIAKRRSHLNAALGDGQKSSLFSSSYISLAIRHFKSAIRHCRLKFLNIFNRKTCQSSWVASLVFSAGWR
ncbi:hypothetical protein CGI09_24075 [Vibrio parahaemolyticus]|nr:hypothetical protein CGJ95_23030 [Vibrio parahaemolyticus]TOH86819.1 hypothetical protein CGI71_22895 [Vibrio parahaemolyticus]TOK99840.1 hypothetical protein CGI09_24075 [Vibrio parahaemolyticus]TOP80659.1 hypothetical protein CGH08_24175 [Vibrio parahaemolyticus]TOP98734.1 hypothetical protein CGH05_20570 [Vibrio parahaemolyticus]